MTLPDLFSLFYNSDPVSVCVVLYVIILIQIRIRYNVRNFITACTRLHDSDPQSEKSPYRGRRHPPPTPSPRSVTSLPRAWSLRSLAFVLNIFLGSEIRNHPPTFNELSTPLQTSTIERGHQDYRRDTSATTLISRLSWAPLDTQRLLAQCTMLYKSSLQFC